MKKKAIEKIPYLGLKKLSRKKNVKYIGVTAVKIIGHEKHLLVEVYQNRKESKAIPLVRIAMTKKDFGTYYPDKGTWNKRKVCPDSSWGSVIWDADHITNQVKMAEENTLQSQGDLDRIKKMCKVTIWDEREWWRYIYEHQDDIVVQERNTRRDRKYERRQAALKDRMDHTGALPEKRILDRADQVFFGNQHYLYYKKRGSWVQIACSKCGGVTDARWRSGESYESQFQMIVPKPREGFIGSCPLCHTYGNYKCQGKAKTVYRESRSMFLGQQYKEQGMVIRNVVVDKEWILECTDNGKGEEMHGAYEQLSGVEIARAYFEPGAAVQIDYHKHNPYTGHDFWDDCNVPGMNTITIHDGKVMPETYDEMKGTMFRYSAMQEYAQLCDTMNPITYLRRYRETPQIEMLVKMRMKEVVDMLLKGYYGIVADENATRPDKFLGIRAERVKQLSRCEGDRRILDAMKMEVRFKKNWTEEQIANLALTGLNTVEVGKAIRYMTVQKLLNRIEKYAGCSYSQGCVSSHLHIQDIAHMYIDYLDMRQKLGYDLHNSVYQYPRDLRAAHREMVNLCNEREMDKRKREVENKYPDIRKNYRKLRKTYYYRDDKYIIRPARSAEEIVMEGRLLHHCVGGDNYLNKHNEGDSYILMLRYAADPDTPYITVEINPQDNSIRQWFGDKDTKPDKNHMQTWIDGYVEYLNTDHENNTVTAVA